MTYRSLDARHCVIIPSFNSGALLVNTVREALSFFRPVIVVIDGSTDESESLLSQLAESDADLHIITNKKNSGKGMAVIEAMEFADEIGFTHAAVFDADGQHEAADLPRFINASRLHPDAMVLGVPIFGKDAPSLRVNGRRAGNFWTNLETLWGGINDSLFGFRVYPIRPALEILHRIRGGRRFDFDTQLAVRLYWKGIPPLNLQTRVHYMPAKDGGITHFHYLRDNLLLIAVHTQLMLMAVSKILLLLRYRRRPPLTCQ